MNHRIFVTALLAGTTAALPLAPASAQQGPPEHSIVRLAGDVYRYQNNQHFGMYQVTDDGIVVVDPISLDAAEWLKPQLAAYAQPVKYVLYSHHHFDHVSGGAAYPDATVISNEHTPENLQPPAADSKVSGFLAGLDTDGSGALEKAEVESNPFIGPQFATLDGNGDGVLTNLELWTSQYANVRVPDETYAGDSKAITLGGQSVEMHYVGGLHANDLSYIWWPEERIVFIVDVISLKRLPFGTMAGFSMDELNRTVDAALELDPAIVSGGHGFVGTKEDLEAFRQYHVDLMEGVKAGIDAGKTLAEIQESLTLDAYKDWGNYAEWRTQNIEGMYNMLTAEAAAPAE